MATHFGTLSWRIPWTEEPVRVQSMGLQRVDTTEQPTVSPSLSATTCIPSWREWDQKKSKPLSKFFFPRASLFYHKVRGRVTQDLPHLAPNHEHSSQTALFLPSPAILSPAIHRLDRRSSLLSVSMLPERSASNPLFPCNHSSLSEM